ncbi:MAG: glycosyltransferase [Fimbriimonadales bacterium]|nr:glycosyltransferase [Fimbriimonadales bacterium]GBC89504.1 N-acetyl-alpha-D-glucosaminyl L-malate synthase [bacterium HR14]GIV14510.1 MAG: glycosyl transferase family 1 [Fimbriimonadales bacterium]CUU05293.1 Glycosyltransferase involved in cell wall bisynthesis [Armatimonadetes bacterium GBS]CUU34031.1 Glycosyltransferase involved in cell wall bisynthesis [Armatimonadetes bacterium GXS]
MKAERVRVLQVIPAFTVGGAEWMATLLATALTPDRFEVHMLSLHPPKQSPMEQMLSAHRIPTHYLNKRAGLEMSVYWRLFRLLTRLKPQIVHTHQTVGRYVYPTCWLARVPVVVHTVHNVAEKELAARWARAFQRLAYSCKVYPVTIADEVEKSFRRVYKRAPVANIPNGILTTQFLQATHQRHRMRSELGLCETTIALICVAALRSQKNHALLIEAYAKVSAAVPNTVLLLVGGGNAFEPDLPRQLEAKVAALNLSDRVRFLGVRSDIPELLAASDVFVLSSEYEGNPLSVMEAMAAGLPVVATAVGGVPELVEPGTGILVPPRDAEALAHAMETLCRDPALRQQMGQKARAVAQARFDIRTMAQQYELLYMKLLQPRDPL